jgi:hypothetical protein
MFMKGLFSKALTAPFGRLRSKLVLVIMLAVFTPVACQVLVLVVGRLQGLVYRLVAPVVPVLLVSVVLGALYWVVFRGMRRR